ncbi:MAG TPA: HAD-IA family hydrolase [Micromonosporaceae bacterium]|jgi:putative hydrolase of the HAD superfamily
MRRRRPTALLVDFDGVLRSYDQRVPGPLETANGLDEGEILAVASDRALLIPAILGRVSRAGWLTDIAVALADRVGGLETAEKLVADWDTYRGEIVPEVLDTIEFLRASGVPVALCTNATDDLREDLARFGLAEAFDAVVSSAEIGYVKPMPEFYRAACEAVDTAPGFCLLVDDTVRNIAGARAAGLLGYRFTSVDDLAYVRAAFDD